jgi:hypothetical protein
MASPPREFFIYFAGLTTLTDGYTEMELVRCQTRSRRPSLLVGTRMHFKDEFHPQFLQLTYNL